MIINQSFNAPWAQLRETPLDISLWQQLLDRYLSNGLTWQAIYVAKQIYRLNPTMKDRLDQQCAGLAWSQSDNGDAALGKPVLNEHAAQTERFYEWLKEFPGDWLTWTYVARLLDFCEPSSRSAQPTAIENAAAYEYIQGESAHLLGVWRLKSGDINGALTALTPLIHVRPVRYGSMMFLGDALLRQGNVLAAEKAFARASLSNQPKFLGLLSATVYQHNYWQEAIAVLKKAVAIDANNVELWLQLAKMQSQVYDLAEFNKSLEHIRRLGWNEEAEHLLMSSNAQLGDAKSYFTALKTAFEHKEDKNTRLISSVLMTSLYQDDLSADEISDVHKQYAEHLVRDSKPDVSAQETKRVSVKANKRNLRVGYVTGDLHRQHPVNIFMLPLLLQQAQSSLEIYVYNTGLMFDEYTNRARSCADQWHDVAAWSDEAIGTQIAEDQIDVLFDLAGHTSSHRLGVFLNRPAPVQVTFLGYPHSTGMKCMDYIIGDSVVSPPEHDSLFVEKVARIDGSVFCWAPVDDYPLPSMRGEALPIVFGSFNNALKLNPATIELWARVLNAVPGSKLLLKAPSFKESTVRDRFVELFAQHGISSSRIEFRGPSELSQMMQEYGDIDIALDPLFYNGGTTSMQALWMGVPLVTLSGQNFASRMGCSFLTNLDRKEWIAEDNDSYVRIAQELAQSILTLRKGRLEQRRRMEATKLCDIAYYAKDFERLVNEMYADVTATKSE